MHVYRDYDRSFVTFYNKRQMQCEPILQNNRYTSFNLGNNYGLHFMQGEKKELSKFFQNRKKISSMKNMKSKKEENKTKKLFHDSSANVIEMRYYQDEEENNRNVNQENNNINIAINIVSQEEDEQNNNNNNDGNGSLGDIKEENLPVEESTQTEYKKSSQINTESSINKNNNNSNLFQRNLSRIEMENMLKKELPNQLSKSISSNININQRNSSTLQFDHFSLRKKNTF